MSRKIRIATEIATPCRVREEAINLKDTLELAHAIVGIIGRSKSYTSCTKYTLAESVIWLNTALEKMEEERDHALAQLAGEGD